MSAPWWDSDWKDRSGPEYRCFVSNLPYSANESSLKDAFANYGALSSEEQETVNVALDDGAAGENISSSTSWPNEGMPEPYMAINTFSQLLTGAITDDLNVEF